MTASPDAVAVVLSGAARAGCVVSVRGMPGIGKSWVLRQATAALRADGLTVLSGSAVEGGWDEPFGIWREVFALDDPDDRNSTWSAGWLPFDEAGAALTDAIVASVSRLARSGRVAIVLDDLHWADDDSVRLLNLLLRGSDRLPASIVVARRPMSGLIRASLDAVEVEIAKASDVCQVDLSRLDDAQSHAVVTAELGARAGDLATSQDWIVDTAGGNPLYLRELCRASLDGTDLSQATTVPPGIAGAVRQRLFAQGPDTVELLQAVAVLPGAFTGATAQIVCGMTDGEFLEALDGAIASGLVVEENDRRLRFEHDIVRHAVAGAESGERHLRRQRLAAERLTDDWSERRSASADHALIAGLWIATANLPGADRGARFCEFAFSTATDSGAYEQAVAFLEGAVLLAGDAPSGERLLAQNSLVWALVDAFRLDDALRLAQRITADPGFAAALGSSSGVAHRLVAMAEGFKRCGLPLASWRPFLDQAVATGEALPSFAGLLIDPIEPVTSGQLNGGRWRGHNPRDVAAIHAEAESTVGAAAASMGADVVLNHSDLLFQPYDHHSLAEIEWWLTRARRQPLSPGALHVLDAVGRYRFFRLGDLEGADACYSELADLAERVRSRALHADALGQRALCVALVGDLDDASALIHQAQDLAEPLRPTHRVRAVTSLLAPGWLGFLRGEGEFDAYGRECLAFATSPDARANVTAPSVAAFSTLLLGMAGDTSAVNELGADLSGLFEQLGPNAYVVNGGLALAARGLFESGASDGADRFLALACEVRDLGLTTGPLGTLEGAIGLLQSLLGDKDRALESLVRYRADVSLRGIAPMVALTDYDAARIDPAAMDPHQLERLAAEFDRLHMHGWAARSRDAPDTRASKPATVTLGPLSKRETEVLTLLAAGRTNKEIAAELFISLATAQRHVANIYLKIDARNRAEAATWAHHNLLGNT